MRKNQPFFILIHIQFFHINDVSRKQGPYDYWLSLWLMDSKFQIQHLLQCCLVDDHICLHLLCCVLFFCILKCVVYFYRTQIISELYNSGERSVLCGVSFANISWLFSYVSCFIIRLLEYLLHLIELGLSFGPFFCLHYWYISTFFTYMQEGSGLCGLWTSEKCIPNCFS